MIKTRMLYFLLTATLCFHHLIAAAQAQIQVLPVNSPPYSMQRHGEVAGYATQVVRLMLEQMQTEQEFAVYPLKRALNIANKEANSLIYPITRSAELEQQFHWIGKLSKQQTYLYKLKTNKALNLTELSQAKSLSIGVVRGSVIETQLNNLGFLQLHQVTAGLQNVRKLLKGRLDLVASDQVTFNHLVDQLNRVSKQKLRHQDFERVLQLPPQLDNPLYIALSKNSTPEVVAQVRAAYHHVKEAGNIVEVVHWWTMGYEKQLTDIYRNFMVAQGISWVDYSFEDGAGSNIEQVLDPQLNSGHIPQAVRSYMGPALQSWDKDQLLNLNSVAETENWSQQLPEVIDQGIKIDGDYFAVPANIQRVNWIWLNPKLLAKVNITNVSTWPQLLQAADKLKDAGYTPIAIGSNPWQHGTLFELLVLSLGGEEFYRQSLIELEPSAFHSESMHQVLDLMAQLKTYTVSTEKNTTWMQATKQVMTGKAAMYFMGDWVNGAVKYDNLPYGDDGIVCIAVPNTEHTLLLNTDVFVFPKSGRKNELSQKTMASMVMNENVQLAFNKTKGSAPARIDLSLNNFDPCTKQSYTLAQQGTILPSFNFGQTQVEQIKNKIVTVVSDYFQQKIDKDEALTKLHAIALAAKQNADKQKLPQPLNNSNHGLINPLLNPNLLE